MSVNSLMKVGAVPSRQRSAFLSARKALVACSVCLLGLAACSPSPTEPAGGEPATESAPGADQATIGAPAADQATIGALAPEQPTAPATVAGAEDKTQVFAFEPSTFARGVGSITPPDTLGACEASVVLPRPNAYKCTTEAGANHDPCFVIAPFQYQASSGSQMGCNPDPTMVRWGAIVRHNGPLPETPATALDPIAFFVSLGADHPGCELIEPRPLGEEMVTFACKAPGAVLVDELDSSVSPWLANWATTDTAGTTITSGPTATPVETAWVW